MLCTALGWWCRHTIADTLQDCALTHTFMTTQPAQFMFAFSVCMVILAVAQVLYVSLDCLGVRTACPAYVLVRSDLLCRGAALLHHHS